MYFFQYIYQPSPSASHVDTPEGHYAAQIGDIEALKRLQAKNRKALTLGDLNGWQPLHEAARAVKFCICFFIFVFVHAIAYTKT